MKREIFEIIASDDVNVNNLDLSNKNIDKLWTIYDEDILWDSYAKFNPLTGEKIVRDNGITINDLLLEHRKGVVLEDLGHDWKLINGKLSYYSRFVKQGEKIKILIEYK